jgi:ribose 5-phosphate isomerase
LRVNILGTEKRFSIRKCLSINILANAIQKKLKLEIPSIRANAPYHPDDKAAEYILIGRMANDQEKEAAARASLQFVQDGTVVGLGTGSTAAYFIKLLGERVRKGLRVRGIPTSVRSRDLAESLGIPLTTLDECQEIAVTVDGADEVDPQLRLIKGGGGALLREKIVASATQQLVIVADASKQVQKLGKFPLPVEVIRFGCRRLSAKRQFWPALCHRREQSHPRLPLRGDRRCGLARARVERHAGRGGAWAVHRDGKRRSVRAGTRDCRVAPVGFVQAFCY